MTPIKELITMLKEAQDIMSEAYHWSCTNGMSSIESKLSVADSCVGEAIDELGLLVAAEHMSDKGYSIGTQEGYEAFVAKREAK
jgi:hypothetical protein